ncbi:MAG: hypothetical protein Salg2KO_11510 [Salibacteraceae bacterium]
MQFTIIFAPVSRKKWRIFIPIVLVVVLALVIQLEGTYAVDSNFGNSLAISKDDLPKWSYNQDSNDSKQETDREEGESFILRFPNIFDVFRSIF